MMSRRAMIAGNALVFAFLAMLIGLGIRSLITQDMRFGWGMFGNSTMYEVTYAWELPDGSTVPATGHRWLKGKPRDLLLSGKTVTTSYGIGAVRSWVMGYGSYIIQRTRNPSFTAFRAEIVYTLNDSWVVKAEAYRFPFTQ